MILSEWFNRGNWWFRRFSSREFFCCFLSFVHRSSVMDYPLFWNHSQHNRPNSSKMRFLFFFFNEKINCNLQIYFIMISLQSFDFFSCLRFKLSNSPALNATTLVSQVQTFGFVSEAFSWLCTTTWLFALGVLICRCCLAADFITNNEVNQGLIQKIAAKVSACSRLIRRRRSSPSRSARTPDSFNSTVTATPIWNNQCSITQYRTIRFLWSPQPFHCLLERSQSRVI